MTFIGAIARAIGTLCVALAGSSALADTITYYHNDLVGSPMAATNQAGQVVWRETYRPYGERMQMEPASAANDVWFTSRKEDPRTELTYMGARYYDARIGRFMAADPVGFRESNVHSFNRYAYANNNPYKYRDPDGRFANLLARASFFLSNEAATALGAATLGSLLTVASVDAWDRYRGFGESLAAPLRNEASDAPKEKEPPVAGATPGRETKGRTTQWDSTGGLDQANRDFDDKNPQDVVSLPDGGRRGTLSDGRRINVRPDSTDGRPTLEIQDGKSRDKVRYDP